MFSKDILLIDIEATGLDVSKHELIQLAAVLLDKKTLKEKSFYSSFLKPSRWSNRQPEAMAVNKINFSTVKNAPAAAKVIKEFSQMFPHQNVILANYGGILDITFLRKAFQESKIKYNYDHHIFNLWGLFYAYMAKHGKFKNKKKFPGFGLEDFIKIFKLKTQTHDALDDCRLEAEILRRVMKQI